MDKSTSAWASAMVTEPDYVTMVTVTADGTTDQYEFNFPGDYLNRSDIKAYMLDEATAIRTDLTVTFVGPTLVKLAPAQPAGVKVTIYRDTPKELPLVDFTDGAMIEARNLDRNAKQCIFAIAELLDRYNIVYSQVELAELYANSARDSATSAAAEAAFVNSVYERFQLTDELIAKIEADRDSAEAYASAAKDSQFGALLAQEGAEAARDATEALAEWHFTYNDTAEGIAATTDGQFFRVPQGPASSVAFRYYRNTSGSAVEVAALPGLELVNDVASRFAGVQFLRGYGNDEFGIIGSDYQMLDYGKDSDRMRDAGADIKYGYGSKGKPLSITGADGEMVSFLTSDSLQDAGVSILRGYAASPFAVLGSDAQILLMGSGGASSSNALPETGLLEYLIAMQERAYTGGHLVIMCGPGDSLTAGTDGLSAIDAMYNLFAANLGHGGIGYFAPSNNNTASRDLLHMELVYTGWVDSQPYGKKCGPLNFALVPWSGRTNLFFRVKDSSRSNPIYQHDVVEVGLTGTGVAGTSSQFRFRAIDRNDDGTPGPAGAGAWQTATVANNPEGSETITIVRVEGLGPGTGRYSLEIEPPASGQAGYPAIVSFNCINSSGGVRVIRYARGGATAAYHLNQTASYQKYWMQYFAPDLVFINLGENDYALSDTDFMAGYSAVVERVQDALPDVPVFLERWYSDNHIKRDAVYDVIQAKYGLLGFNVRDLIRSSNYAFQNGYAYSTTNPADPHPNSRGARIIGAYQAKRALLNYAVQSLRK